MKRLLLRVVMMLAFVPIFFHSQGVAQFADDSVKKVRYIGDFQIKDGISPGEADYVQGCLMAAYATGRFDIWTAKNLFDKLNKEKALASTKDCLDVSCITRAYSCKGIIGSLAKVGSKYSLTLGLVTETGATTYSKSVLMASIDNARTLKQLMYEVYSFFEEGKDFDETKYSEPGALGGSAPSSGVSKARSASSSSEPLKVTNATPIKNILKLSGVGLVGLGAASFVTGFAVNLAVVNPAFEAYSNATYDFSTKWNTVVTSIDTMNVFYGLAIGLGVLGIGSFVTGLLLPEKNGTASFWIFPDPSGGVRVAFESRF